MKRLLGTLLIVLGAGGGGYAVLVGAGFTAIYLMGYVGTDGNEAGRELVWMGGFTLAVALISYGLVRLGQRLRRPG